MLLMIFYVMLTDPAPGSGLGLRVDLLLILVGSRALRAVYPVRARARALPAPTALARSRAPYPPWLSSSRWPLCPIGRAFGGHGGRGAAAAWSWKGCPAVP
eukprot:SAG31_NODE_2582_length_5436_cov_1.573356_2_plen_101_part_00